MTDTSAPAPAVPDIKDWPLPPQVVPKDIFVSWAQSALNAVQVGLRRKYNRQTFSASLTIKMDLLVMGQVYNKYVKDLKKLKYVHRFDPDKYKVAGYAAFWMAKLKPVKFIYDQDPPVIDEDYAEELLFSNEDVAYLLGCIMVEKARNTYDRHISQEFITRLTQLIGTDKYRHFRKDFRFTYRFRPNGTHITSMFFEALYS